ncbi:unnamed protein product, partial [marine sediment metagenome]
MSAALIHEETDRPVLVADEQVRVTICIDVNEGWFSELHSSGKGTIHSLPVQAGSEFFSPPYLSGGGEGAKQ